MRKLTYLFAFVFTSVLLSSCGAGSSQSCVSSKTIKLKDHKFENYEVVVSQDQIYTDDIN